MYVITQGLLSPVIVLEGYGFANSIGVGRIFSFTYSIPAPFTFIWSRPDG